MNYTIVGRSGMSEGFLLGDIFVEKPCWPWPKSKSRFLKDFVRKMYHRIRFLTTPCIHAMEQTTSKEFITTYTLTNGNESGLAMFSSATTATTERTSTFHRGTGPETNTNKYAIGYDALTRSMIPSYQAYLILAIVDLSDTKAGSSLAKTKKRMHSACANGGSIP
jgi:hypothetical protein